MKKFLLLCAFIQISFAIYSQITFAPIGATWYYDHTYFYGSNVNDYAKLDVIGDTTIEGKLCSIIFIENAYVYAAEFPDSIYLHFDSGRVYRYFDQYDLGGLQYVFNAQVGDTLTVYGMAFSVLDSFPVVVDSVGTIDINNHNLRLLSYRDLFLNWEFDQNVIEGIGGMTFLFPKYTVAENTISGLRCYEDSSIGFYNTGIVNSCDTIKYLGLTTPVTFNHVIISPTIFNSYLKIDNNSEESFHIDVFNQIGWVIKDIEVRAKCEIILGTTNWNDGLYIIKTQMKNVNREFKLLKLSPQ